MRNWLLPEYIEDILPPEAEQIERLRRTLLERFHRHGYLLVQPPLLEHMDSLLTGTGRDLDLLTFKVVDQLSGRLLGLRADMTPQVARIDAHLLNRQSVTRLCYAGSVLRTLPPGLDQSREGLQLGAELYGHAGVESDREVLKLLLGALQTAGVNALHLDIGHVGAFRALASAAGLTADGEIDLFAALRAKDHGEVAELTAWLPEPWRGALKSLPTLYGPADDVLRQARALLPPLVEVQAALTTLEALAAAVGGDVASLHVDLADLRGYHYHTGVIFEVFIPGQTTAIARGGRYDDIGRAFGRARPATGFTLDLRLLAAVVPNVPLPLGILAPDDNDPALARSIDVLRADGETVITRLPGSADDPAALNVDRELVQRNGVWQIVLLPPHRSG